MCIRDKFSLDEGRLAAGRDGLLEKGLITIGEDGQASLTETGSEEMVRLGAARYEVLKDLVDCWSPEADEEMAPVLARLNDELAATEVPN